MYKIKNNSTYIRYEQIAFITVTISFYRNV